MNRTIFSFSVIVLVLCLPLLYTTSCKKSENSNKTGKQEASAPLDFAWPPQLGQKYPNIKLVDQTGEVVELKKFKGKVIIVEPIGMNCPGCNAYAGGNKPGVGGYGGTRPQPGIKSFEEYLKQYGRVDLNHPDIAFVQLLLYDLKMGVPTAEDARKWAAHFGMDRKKNHIVLAGVKGLHGKAGYKMIPGFQLIDRNFVLQVDSTGHHPKHNPYQVLMPKVKEFLRQ